MTTIELSELMDLASCDVCQSAEWVTPAWAMEHFGSEAEAKFIVAASPATIIKLITEITRLQAQNAMLNREHSVPKLTN